MLSTFELMTYSIAAALLLPLALWSLAKGSPAPQNTILSKYYAAEKYLNVVGNLFLVTVCAHAIAGLAQHFGLIGTEMADAVRVFVGVPFAVLLAAFLALWAKAAIKIRREGKAAV